MRRRNHGIFLVRKLTYFDIRTDNSCKNLLCCCGYSGLTYAVLFEPPPITFPNRHDQYRAYEFLAKQTPQKPPSNHPSIIARPSSSAQTPPHHSPSTSLSHYTTSSISPVSHPVFGNQSSSYHVRIVFYKKLRIYHNILLYH